MYRRSTSLCDGCMIVTLHYLYVYVYVYVFKLLYCTILFCTILYCTVLYEGTVLYCTILYYIDAVIVIYCIIVYECIINCLLACLLPSLYNIHPLYVQYVRRWSFLMYLYYRIPESTGFAFYFVTKFPFISGVCFIYDSYCMYYKCIIYCILIYIIVSYCILFYLIQVVLGFIFLLVYYSVVKGILWIS